MSSNNQPDLAELINAMRAGQADAGGSVSRNGFNILVMAAAAAAGALVWNTVVATPKDFGVISQQTAEIRTTVLEMKGTLGDITTRLDNNTKATADQQAKITGLEMSVKSNAERIDRLDQEISRVR